MSVTPSSLPSWLTNAVAGAAKPISDAVSSAKQDVSSLVSPTGPGMSSPYPGMDQDQKANAASAVHDEDQSRKAAGYGLPYRAAAPVAQALGVNVGGMEQSAKEGSVGGVLGHAALPLASLAVGEAIPHLLPGEHPQVAAEALQEHANTGGSTYEPSTGQNLAGSRKLVVGIAPEHAAISEEPITPERYSNFVATHRDLLQRNPSMAVGTHFDPETGMHSLELVGTTPSSAAAQNLAAHLGENHVYNLATDKIMPTGIHPDAVRSPSPLSVEERVKYLNENSPQKETYSGTHYSDASLDTISGSHRGLPTDQKAIPGAESARIRLGTKTGMGPDAPGGFYTHAADSMPDARTVSRKNAYGIRGQFAFASTDGPDFQGGYTQGVQDAIAKGADPNTAHQIGLNAAEIAVKNAGFDGYHTPQHPDIRFHFGDAQATPVASHGGQTFYDGTNAEGARAIKKAGTVAGHPDVLKQSFAPGTPHGGNAADKQGFIAGQQPELPSAMRGRGEPLEYGFDHEIATGPDLGAQVRGGAAPKPSTRTPNASGESSASQEAINRVSQEKAQGASRVAVNTLTGAERPLTGVDAVDYRPQPHESVEFRGGNRDGEIIVQGSAARPYNRADTHKAFPSDAKAGADADTALFAQAKKENPNGNFSSWAQRASDLKDGKVK